MQNTATAKGSERGECDQIRIASSKKHTSLCTNLHRQHRINSHSNDGRLDHLSGSTVRVGAVFAAVAGGVRLHAVAAEERDVVGDEIWEVYEKISARMKKIEMLMRL